MPILLTGGAGYIGSHIAYDLAQHNEKIISLDRNPQGNRIEHHNVIYVWGDIGDAALVTQLCAQHNIDTLIHCAAEIEVGASVTNPGLFYQENVAKTIMLFNATREHGVKHILFSSSCAVYGTPAGDTFRESDTLQPISPYGETKRVIEQLLTYYGATYAARALSFRYANASGATITPACAIGERHDPETHLIPRAIAAALSQTPFHIFGDSHLTPDGTCIRDYVHVRDIARAHRLGLERLRAGGATGAYNLGTGVGYSVQEILEMVTRVTEKEIQKVVCAPRAGDPPRLVADITHARTELGWQPTIGLEEIIRDAYAWHIAKSASRSSISSSLNIRATAYNG